MPGMMNKFQAQIKHSPPVTMLHTLTCPSVRGEAQRSTGDTLRLVRAPTVAEAVLDLIATYMSNDVRRRVSVCRCAADVQPARSSPRR
jgi:hypothetical protein